ncbi:MAG: hypothetical protein M9890_07925 [Thermomicrobiales bacterium]|nr:hypothetical protein [Thermomicrobiales bacterium]
MTWSVIDESTIISSTGCNATTVTADTIGTTLTCEATSEGGTSSQSVTFKRDATPPTVLYFGPSDGSSYLPGTVPEAGCTTLDALSGVATNATLSTSGGPSGSITVTCSGATDNAGNTAAAVSVTYNIVDTTAPSITYIFDTNGTVPVNGWYGNNLTLTWVVTEPESPDTLVLDGCEDQIITGDLPITTFSCSATSAGGTAGPVTITFGNDKTAPDMTFTGLTADAIYPLSAVPVPVCEATDATSGMADGFPTLTYDGGPLGTVVAICSAKDVYGNTRQIGVHYTVIDDTAPVITPTLDPATPDAANGWYSSDITVSWTVEDESPISASAGCDTTTLDTDTTGATLTCEATSAGGTSSQSVTIKRDATAPVVSVTGVADGASYVAGSVPAAGCTTVDATSGVATDATLLAPAVGRSDRSPRPAPEQRTTPVTPVACP